MGGVAVNFDLGDTFGQGLGQAIFETFNPGQALGNLGRGQLRGHAHAHNTDEVFGAGPALVFLEAAVDERPDGRAFADVEGADPRGAIELVGRQAQEIYPQLLHVHGDDAGGGHRVGVHHHLALPGDLGDVGDGFDSTDLVVGQHDADENGLGRDGLLHLGRVYQAIFIHVQGGNAVVQEAEGGEFRTDLCSMLEVMM